MEENKRNRHSIRMMSYDYSSPGAYFITICTYQKKSLFGKIVNGIMRLNKFGYIIEREWLNTKNIRSYINLDEFVIMPNHIHGIVFLKQRYEKEKIGKGVLQYAPTNNGIYKPVFYSPSYNIGAIIRGFKATVTKQINGMCSTPQKIVWLRNYYERIIRNDDELNRIREYIINNPLKWEFDKENPAGKTNEEENKFWALFS